MKTRLILFGLVVGTAVWWAGTPPLSSGAIARVLPWFGQPKAAVAVLGNAASAQRQEM